MHFVAFLRDAGIPNARTFNQGGMYPGLLGIDVAVGSDAAERGRALYDEFRRLPLVEHIPDESVAPDLSLLDPSTAPRCPACRTKLPLAAVTACTSCGEPVDVAELIVQEHGPEALTPCYPKRADTDEAPDLLTHCLACGYALENLPSVGVCPECGGPFDKSTPPDAW